MITVAEYSHVFQNVLNVLVMHAWLHEGDQSNTLDQKLNPLVYLVLQTQPKVCLYLQDQMLLFTAQDVFNNVSWTTCIICV